jgi:hypothetical protein
MSFEKLFSEIQELGSEQETMNKALPAGDGADDENIQAAAEDGGDMDGAGAEDGAGEDTGDDGDDTLGKSLGTVTLADGTKADAIDGTELVKSLMSQVDELKSSSTAREGQMTKALEGAVGLLKTQQTMLKSLQEQVTKLGGVGRGRKAVLTISEKIPAGSAMNKSEAPGMSGQEFMAKALDAQKAGRIQGVEVATIEGYLNRGMPVPAHLIARVSQ